jgi:hypothetical protein
MNESKIKSLRLQASIIAVIYLIMNLVSPIIISRHIAFISHYVLNTAYVSSGLPIGLYIISQAFFLHYVQNLYLPVSSLKI